MSSLMSVWVSVFMSLTLENRPFWGHKHLRVKDVSRRRRWDLRVIQQEQKEGKHEADADTHPPSRRLKNIQSGRGAAGSATVFCPRTETDTKTNSGLCYLALNIFKKKTFFRKLNSLTSSVVQIWRRFWFERTRRSRPERAWAYSWTGSWECCLRCLHPCLQDTNVSLSTYCI